MGRRVLVNEDDNEVCIEPSLEELIEEFGYKVRPTSTHKEILKQIEIYYTENEKFQKKENRAAARRARRALLKLFHLVRERRIEMLDIYRDW